MGFDVFSLVSCNVCSRVIFALALSNPPSSPNSYHVYIVMLVVRCLVIGSLMIRALVNRYAVIRYLVCDAYAPSPPDFS